MGVNHQGNPRHSGSARQQLLPTKPNSSIPNYPIKLSTVNMTRIRQQSTKQGTNSGAHARKGNTGWHSSSTEKQPGFPHNQTEPNAHLRNPSDTSSAPHPEESKLAARKYKIPPKRNSKSQHSRKP